MSEDGRGFSIGWIPTVATLAGLALLLTLGTWQTREYFEKERRETLQERRLDRDPAPIDSLNALDDALNYRRVEVSGSLDTETRIVVKHRSHDGNPGSWLVQPFRFQDGGRLLVNRGWIPFQKAQEDLDPYAAPPRQSTLVGLLYRLPNVVSDDAARGKLDDDGGMLEGRRTEWDSFDATALYDHVDGPTPGGPWVLVLGPRHTGDRYPIASYQHVTEPYLTSTRHLSYGVFWFTVAAALVGIYIAAGFGALQSRERGRAKVPSQNSD